MPYATTQKEPDVIVVGGGPSGSTAATLIAQKGHSVTLLERDRFPRFHIGESLIPQTYWVLQRLKMLDKLKGSRFIKKFSVQFVSDKGRLSEPFYFLEHNPHESSQTWQVLRSDFDHKMLRNAQEQGVDVREGVRVIEVLFEGDRAVGVRCQDEAGSEHTLRAKVIVDASGQSSLIQSRLGLREWDPVLKKAALWTYWEGAYRDTGPDEGATMVLQVQGKKGWFWYIPLHDNIISVGVVAAHEYLFKDRPEPDHEAIYHTEVSRCPGLIPRLQGAKRAGPFRAAKEYSYRTRQVAGDGWVLVGDALGFLDPLYSSGVLLALRSGEYAADAVTAALAKGDTSESALRGWEQEYFTGMERMRKLVCAYYDGFSFGRFVQRYPHWKGKITDLLIGDLFKDGFEEVFEKIDEMKAEMALAA